jgi:hypothetical protein
VKAVMMVNISRGAEARGARHLPSTGRITEATAATAQREMWS